MKKILIIDDEKSVQESLTIVLADSYKVITAFSGKEGLELLLNNDINLVFLDIILPDGDGINILKEIKKINPELPVIMLTAVSKVSTAVEAMKLGAHDYLTKPFDVEEIRVIVKKIFDQLRVKQKFDLLATEIENLSGIIVCESQKMKDVLSLASKAALYGSSVLITGPTGSGKELIARFIHKESERKNEPFVAIHCAAIPETLFESEIFGYEKGAFTGAFKSKPGKLEIAGAGTVFFDEIGEMPVSLQIKMLRVLQEREFSRVGSNESIKFEARVLAATSRDLKKEIELERFREDLFYRLSVIPINVPSLKERKEDILPLAYHFLSVFRTQMDVKTKSFSPEAEKILVSYDWPGNVRELKNIVERVLVLKGNKDIINADDLPEDLKQTCVETFEDDKPFEEKVAEFEKRLILETLNKFNWNKSKAAEHLRMSRRVLGYKVEKYGIRPEEKNIGNRGQY
ncbi:MAG: sigma-54 dependent transcriptional regulator [Candidatus Omnitrophica bacterium]|nr:sigma-54 dependent transcriptional regulator [Candidatus Omnitrophota bacterium]